MIELERDWVPDSAQPELIDFGGVQRPATGAKLLRVERGGSRFRVAFTLPTRTADDARRIVARLIAARREGLRMNYPLLGVRQGMPSAPVVDGPGQAGMTLAVRGLTPSYAAKEGFWLSIVDASGQHYLHNLRAQTIAGTDGKAVLAIQPMLRVPFPDGAVVHLSRPMIEGLVETSGWQPQLGGLVGGIAFTIEEAA